MNVERTDYSIEGREGNIIKYKQSKERNRSRKRNKIRIGHRI